MQRSLALKRSFSEALRENWQFKSCLKEFPPERIRNFCIIAHIDHGKSTLADRLLEMSGTIETKSSNKQVLDKLLVERERGITVKAQSASLFWNHHGQEYLLNLIDTPGHVDFSYEVSRSLAACDGAILLVDASQGIQAQTMANFWMAFSNNLKIIPVINKIDLPGADVNRTMEQLQSQFEFDPQDCLQISAKSGLNVKSVFGAIIDKLPSPSTSSNQHHFRGLLFDSWFDEYKGVICLIAVKSGSIKKGDCISCFNSNSKYEILDLGIMHPHEKSTDALFDGQVGYIVTGMKSTKEAVLGDTFFLHKDKDVIEPLAKLAPSKPMVFAGLFPSNNSDFENLEGAINKLTLNDASVTIQKEFCDSLGQGWKIGFLGTLHMDVFRERLEKEYNAEIIVTSPTVPYKLVHKAKGTEELVTSPSQFPPSDQMYNYRLFEPMINATIILPPDNLGAVINLCGEKRGLQLEMDYIDQQRIILRYKLPLSEIVVNFYDQLKSITSGYATFDYEPAEYEESDLVKISMLINGDPIHILSSICHRTKAESHGRSMVQRLKSVLHRQQFEVIMQAAIGTRIIARERLQPYRKDVTAKLYGGDGTRKMKLLENQKESKRRMKMIGRVEISHEAFLKFLKSE